MSDVITTPDGEDIYIRDLLVGLDSLPRRQREAFELICLQGYTETAARDKMLPNSRSSTPVQQYSDSGLIRMVAKYDELQAGPLLLYTHLRRSLMATLHPILKKGLEETRKEILHQLDGLKLALTQVDEMLGKPVPQPAPNPKPDPENKPKLEDMAREMASAGAEA